MDKFSSSTEPSFGDFVRFGTAGLGLFLGISGIIFAQPVLGILGVIMALLALLGGWRSYESD